MKKTNRLLIVLSAAALVVTVVCLDTSEAKKRKAQKRKAQKNRPDAARKADRGGGKNAMRQFLATLPEDQRKQAREIHKDVRRQIQELLRKANARIRQILNGEQRKQFDAIVKQMEDQRKNRRAHGQQKGKKRNRAGNKDAL
jgi:hypothetical protein